MNGSTNGNLTATERQILDALRRLGPLNAVQLAEVTGIAARTVRYAVSRLEERKLVHRPEGPRGPIHLRAQAGAKASQSKARSRQASWYERAGAWYEQNPKEAQGLIGLGLTTLFGTIAWMLNSGIVRSGRVAQHQSDTLAGAMRAGGRLRDTAERVIAGFNLWWLKEQSPADPVEAQRAIRQQAAENTNRQLAQLDFVEKGLRRAAYAPLNQQVAGLQALGMIRQVAVDLTPQPGVPSVPLTAERAKKLKRLDQQPHGSSQAVSGFSLLDAQQLGLLRLYEPGPAYPFDFPPARAIATQGSLIPTSQLGPLITVLSEWVAAEKAALIQQPALPESPS